MATGQHGDHSLDLNTLSAELLCRTLGVSGAGLFYSPASIGEDKVLHFSQHYEPGQTWSMNLLPLFGLSGSLDEFAALLECVVETDRHLYMACVNKAIAESLPESDCEFRIQRADNGELRWLKVQVIVGRNELGEVDYIASLCLDVTKKKQAQLNLERSTAQLEQAQKYLRAALSASNIAIFCHGIGPEKNFAAQEYKSWNFNLAQIYGYPADTEMTPEKLLQRMSEEDLAASRVKAQEAMSNNQFDFHDEFSIQWDDQSTHWLLSKSTLEFDDKGQPDRLSGAVIDITDRKMAEEQMKYIATHDVLTSLPNRLMFSNLLVHNIQTARRYENRFALFFIDLDHFKAINDALGHQAGDQLLVGIADRLRNCLRTADVLARISGDEFVLLAPLLESVEDATVVARKIIAEISKPMVLLGQSCQVTASVGICLYPEHGDDEQALMKNADSAMYAAKEMGKNNYQFFNSSSSSKSLERMAIENELRSALINNELSLHYQAKLDLSDDSITGVEALLRWNNPTYGNIPPAHFIPIAEETGLIIAIGRWVLMTACQQNVDWQRQGLPPLCVSVNLSSRQFLNAELLNIIREALAASGMAPELLELEITETMVMHNVDQAVTVLHDIKKLGVRIAIDDFGAGYSSLAQLKRFPIDTLKVDRSFISQIAHDTEDQAITEAIIAMGKSLGLTIIAEGVETKEQQDFLRGRACDEMQGYYFSRPVVPKEFSEFFNAHAKSSVVKKAPLS